MAKSSSNSSGIPQISIPKGNDLNKNANIAKRNGLNYQVPKSK